MSNSVQQLTEENQLLRQRIQELEKRGNVRKCSLSGEQIERYGRHLILPGFGVEAQERVCSGRVLVVGAGGLGSPCLLYLAGCGVGKIGIVDSDIVEVSNLHRQVIHRSISSHTKRSKASSAMEQCLELNPLVSYQCFEERFTADNAMRISQEYDIIVDCSDNPMTRYLINDVAMAQGKVVVSGSALRGEGQLTIYGYKSGPCYRCLFPTPPPASSVTSCSDGGVLGPVPGIIGCMQAMEVLKLLSGVGEPLSGRLLVMDALDMRLRIVKLRGKQIHCKGCGQGKSLDLSAEEYAQFCGVSCSSSLKIGNDVSCQYYNDEIMGNGKHLLIDVREKVQFDICSLSHAVNMPISGIDSNIEELRELSKSKDIFVMCRRGIFSQRVVNILLEHGITNCYTLKGGLQDWAQTIDHKFPLY